MLSRTVYASDGSGLGGRAGDAEPGFFEPLKVGLRLTINAAVAARWSAVAPQVACPTWVFFGAHDDRRRVSAGGRAAAR